MLSWQTLFICPTSWNKMNKVWYTAQRESKRKCKIVNGSNKMYWTQQKCIEMNHITNKVTMEGFKTSGNIFVANGILIFHWRHNHAFQDIKINPNETIFSNHKQFWTRVCVSKCIPNAKPLKLFLMKLNLSVELKLLYFFSDELTMKVKDSIRLHLVYMAAPLTE